MSEFEVFKEFTFDAAHRLTEVPEGHQCGRPHGHTYRVTVYAVGPLHPRLQWVIDYAQLTEAWERECKRHLDHHDLNEFFGVGEKRDARQTTSENVAKFIYDMMSASVKEDSVRISRVTVRETATAGCTYPAR